MRRQSFFTLVFLAIAFLPGLTAQSSGGQNPSLIMYRWNGGGISPQPVIQGNLIGTVRWDGLTAIGSIRTGAAIQSFVTDAVTPGVLQANMIFRTSDNLVGLTNRMIITEDGLVGIGLDNPAPNFRLDVLGNTHTSGNFYGRIHFDVGAPTGLPGTYTDEAYFEQKNRAALGLAANTYSDGGILSLAPGGNSLDRQLFSGGTDGLWTRSQDGGGGNTWAAWQKILTSADINGNVGRVARFTGANIGDPSSALGNSQFFDDGTRVGIRNFAPDAGTDIDITGATRINGNLGLGTLPTSNRLEVSGNSRLNGDANVTGNLDVDANVNVDGDLQLDGDGRVDGNVGIGKAPTAFDLDIAGESNFDGRVKIGASAFPTSTTYKLAVGGGVMAEEVRVQLQAWPDYVFEKEYPLTPLAAVEQYIGENKHLPGIASANEVAEDGLNLGEMQKAQMEKIEEIYLHLIELEKETKAIKAENAALKAKIEQLEQRN